MGFNADSTTRTALAKSSTDASSVTSLVTNDQVEGLPEPYAEPHGKPQANSEASLPRTLDDMSPEELDAVLFHSYIQSSDGDRGPYEDAFDKLDMASA